MFYQVSWITYLVAFAIVAAVYYIVITPLFFRKQLKRFFSRANDTPSGEQSASGKATTPVTDYFTYEKLRDEITAYLEGEEKETLKSDILFSLVSIIKTHPPLQDERFQGALGKEIRRLYNEQYIDSLSEEEIASLWNA